ncbi:MAG: hypothetical protein GX860_11060, partial [Alcaligenaceae bacterium]|nr:hypothetical protein [Alcaligenaceae bacterium]
SEKENTTWTIEDGTLATVSEKGKDGYVYAKKAGQSFINAFNAKVGYTKRILLVVVNSEEELSNTYVLAFEDAYKRTKPEDILSLSLVTGSAGFPEAEIQNIVWSATENNVLEITGSGKNVSIRAKNEGIATVTATHSLCVKPASITIEVRKEGTVLIPDAYSVAVDKIKGIVVGNTATLTASFFDSEGTPATTNLYSTIWEIEDPSIATISGNSNVCMIQAVGLGQTYVTLKHPKLTENVRILIYTANTEAELAVKWPLATDKQNYLLDIGESATLTINTITNDVDKTNGIRWSVESSSIINYSVISKKEITITGRAAGNTKITVAHDNSSPVVYYVSVRDPGAIDTSKKITTECIIGMVKGSSKTTTIQSNLTAAEIASLTWQSRNEGIVTVAGNGENATLEAVEVGETFVTVQFGTIKRNILVYVCNTQEEVNNYCAMNIDNQYYRIGINDVLTLGMFFSPNYPASINQTSYTNVYNNNVIEVNDDEGRGIIKGLAEGIATVRIENPDCTTPINVTIVLSKKHNGSTGQTSETKYLTVSKTLYHLNIEETTIPAKIVITGIGMTSAELLQTQWTIANTEICSITASGNEALVYPKKLGTTQISIVNPYSGNNIELSIIVKKKNEENITVPYISVPEEVVTLARGEEKTFTCTMINKVNSDPMLYGIAQDSTEFIKVTKAGNVITVMGKLPGQTLLTITHPDSQYETKVLVVVSATEGDNIIFLTTENNYVSLTKNNNKAVQVELKNYEDYNADNYTWTIEDESIASIQGIGRSCIITAKEIGAARIQVTHKYAPYPLEIVVRVTSDIKDNPIFITTQSNILSVKEGETIGANVSLKNGNEAEYSLFSWGTDQNEIIQLVSSGQQATIKALKAGVAYIRIAHPSSLNTISLVIMVEPKQEDSGIYITTDSALIQMKPTDSSKTVNVRLVGGNPEDIYGFAWKIVSYDSILRFSDGTSKPVIELVNNADVGYIVPKNEGTAIIQVTHPKTGYKLNITVNVQLYNAIKFSQANVSLPQGNNLSVSVEAPSGEVIIYESNDPTIAGVTGTNKMCIVEGLKEGTTIITARTLSGNSYDELLVKVNPSPAGEVKYIKASTNLLNLVNTQAAVVVNAELVGTGFTEEDNNNITWQSENTNVVTVYGTGKSCSVTPKGIGETTVIIRHAKLSGYMKRMYVKVTASD